MLGACSGAHGWADGGNATIMGSSLVLIVTILYGAVAVEKVYRGDYANALVWGAYAAANIGMILGGRT